MLKRFSYTLPLLVCALLSACAQGGNRYTYGYYSGHKPTAAHPARPATDYYTVRKGDTLYSIAWAYGRDVRELARWNNIRAPYTIYPDQKLRVSPPDTVSAHHRTRATSEKRNTHRSRTRQPVTDTHSDVAHEGEITWQWPTKGKIISRYSAKGTGKKGINIAGTRGQPIYAAARGRVVYVGGGLRGYGKLIILKHSDTYFSAYAHNRRLHVKEDQEVKKGQRIADMGGSGSSTVMLHFEVRRNGKPVDPLKYLPKRR
jgi:lipoprotein NlpD